MSIDSLYGGLGNDSFTVSSNGESTVIVESSGEGIDIVNSGATTYSLAGNVEKLILKIGTYNISGIGNELDNNLMGNDGANSLTGGLGNDTLNGGKGIDTLIGGAGDDIFYVDNVKDFIIEDLNAGNDTVSSTVSYTLNDNIDTLIYTGTVNSTLIGNSSNNVINIINGKGNDSIVGGAGADTMIGGLGNDTYRVDDNNDVVVENVDAGTDTIISSAPNYTLADNVKYLILDSLAGAINGNGNSIDNTIVGNSNVNILAGGDGNDLYRVQNQADVVNENPEQGTDTIQASETYSLPDNVEILVLKDSSANIDGYGNSNDNTIIADASGANNLYGGDGNDTYLIDNNSVDHIYELDGEGIDTIQSKVSYALDAYQENLTLTDKAITGIGNELDNYIIGTAGKNTLSGGLGDDTLDSGKGADSLIGGVGNDTYITYTSGTLGEKIYEKSGEGIDTIIFAATAGTFTLASTMFNNIENLALAGTSNINATGNALDNTLTGNSGNNALDGGVGVGADVMQGGAGNDTYTVNNIGDLVVEDPNKGNDTAKSKIASYTLTANVENLTLDSITGTVATDGTGNEINNSITGNKLANSLYGLAGDDTLNGGIGADTMVGGTGDDTYIIDNIGDSISESADEGIDTVQSSLTFTLDNNFENLTLTGSLNINGTGNAADNTLEGNTGVNILTGGAGDDTYKVNKATDQVIETDASTLTGGIDTVKTSALSYTLSDNVENLTLLTGASIGQGNSLNNIITSNTGIDTLIGGAGDDTYYINNSSDKIVENSGEGNDIASSKVGYTIGATSDLETLVLTGTSSINASGNAINNTIVGNSGKNTIYGMDGDDFIDGGDNIDSLYGGLGNDTILGGEGNDYIDGGTGKDVVGGAGKDSLIGGTGNDTYVVDDSDDKIKENTDEGIDLVKSNVSYTLSSDIEKFTLTGSLNLVGVGNDQDNFITGNNGTDSLCGMGGNDTLVGGTGADTLDGGTENDSLSGGIGNGTLYGGDGDDTVDGGAGADTMYGGAGNDRFTVDNLGDVVNESLNEGNDTVISSVSHTLAANVENLTLSGSAAIGVGNELANSILGNAGNNTLNGLDGNDTILGGAGNDIIDGGTGVDSMVGGVGNDIYLVDNDNDAIKEDLNAGADTVKYSVVAGSYTLGDNLESLILVEGVGNINGTGNTANNTITGNSGSNILNGGGGIDKLTGGSGNDIYIIEDNKDIVTEAANQGIDTVITSGTYILGLNVENLTLAEGAGNINGTGNTLANTITGNSSNNTIDGGVGVDYMAGKAGNDLYTVDNIGDVILENIGEGIDTVKSKAASYTLSGNIENLILDTITSAISGTGNILNNTITGNKNNNTIDGNGGTDLLIGGAGNDTFIVDSSDDVIRENAKEGTDIVRSSAASYTLSANVENLTLIGTDNINGSGNDLANTIIGNTGNNSLSGGLGNDTITGGTGVDTLIGGIGNDTYYVDNSADVIVEDNVIGVDVVYSSANYTISSNIEKLILTGTAQVAEGNTLDNSILGDTLANTLYGMAGNDSLDSGVDTMADTLYGGTGNDIYYINGVTDIAIENASEGNDTISSAVNFSLNTSFADNIENLTLTGAAINGTGNDFNNYINTDATNKKSNILAGGLGDDTIDGGTLGDSMYGGIGNDYYIVDNASDKVYEEIDQGNDTVLSSVIHSLAINVENLTLTGSSNINATGNASNNTLKGNRGNNAINGGIGADTMAGGIGNDTYTVDDAGDIIQENLDEGIDTVSSSITYSLSANVENLTLTGSTNIDATGNALNNTLTGNKGNNILTGLAGNDTYIIDKLTDQVIETDASTLTGGIDTVQSSISYTLLDNFENLTLLAGGFIGEGNAADNTITGSAANNTLTGNAGNDYLDGGLGNDTMTGGTGDDTYVVNVLTDKIVENPGEGIDTVKSSVSYTLSDMNLENLILTGVGALRGYGNSLNNIITSNTGQDTLAGGTGDDVYYINGSNVTISENPEEDNDIAYTNVNYTLKANSNVETLVLAGTSNLQVKGDAIANTILGNSGNNMIDGGVGADSLIGGEGNDAYIVDNADDRIKENADEGIDTVTSSAAAYTMDANIEKLIMDALVTSAIRGAGNDENNSILGNKSNNILYGFGGNDSIDGLVGADAMYGGAGDDIYYNIDNIGDTATENLNEGTDLVISKVSFTISNNIENLTLTGAGALKGYGNASDNTIISNTGIDTLAGGDGDDTYYIYNAKDIILENLGEGADTVYSKVTYSIKPNIETLILIEGAGKINAIGNGSANTIIGNSGNNSIDGSTGADSLIGGLGNDTYYVDNTDDNVKENANEGIDTVMFSAPMAGTTYTLDPNVENLTMTDTIDINGNGNELNNTITGNKGINVLTGKAGNDTYIIQNLTDTVIESLNEGIDTVLSSVNYELGANIENLTLQPGAISGTGNGLDNYIIGNTSGNSLYGLAGDDTLDGGTGKDTMYGGTGNDTYKVDNSGDLVCENENEGTDTVISTVTYTVPSRVENLILTGVGVINGYGNRWDNSIVGNIKNNILYGYNLTDSLYGGSDDNDTLDGGAGVDIMYGGDGNDIYFVDNIADKVIENANKGIDAIYSSVSYTLAANFENLVLTGTTSINGYGNELDNTITGNSKNNILAGGDGNDIYVIDLGTGNSFGQDVITDNAGTNTLKLNMDDTNIGYFISNQDLVIRRGSDKLTIVDWFINNNFDGIRFSNNELVAKDTINSACSEMTVGSETDDDLSGDVGVDYIDGGAGNDYINGGDGNDILIGGDGNDTIDGGTGADDMSGGDGNDTYYVDNTGDIASENPNEGIDTVISSVNFSLNTSFAANIEILILDEAGNINGTGNDMNNTIIGNGSNNILDGGIGADTMIGGLGDDTYIVDNINDVVTEDPDAGVDIVQSSINYSLSADVDNLTLTGTSNINGTGNDLDNVITGNSGTNILTGHAGNDTYIIQNSTDTVIEGLNEGIDEVESSTNFTLNSNIENLTLTGTGNINGVGNELANTIIGNIGNNSLYGGLSDDTIYGRDGNDTIYGGDGNDYLLGENGTDYIYGELGDDTINGGSGADIMVGGDGADLYYVDNTSDAITENLNQGYDTVIATASYSLSANIEILDLSTGIGDLYGYGNASDNTIIGNSGNNDLNGYGGNDTYYIQNSGDVVTEGIADPLTGGIDTVISTVSYILGNNTENLTLQETGNINGTGNTLANTIIGNSSNNTLDGGAGADSMIGGLGNDIYIVDNVNDAVAENLNAGIDEVRSSSSDYTLSSNIEILTLTGSANINGTGNDLVNTIVGNSGNNIINGGTGADSLVGGAGNDIYYVDAGDIVDEVSLGGAGIDEVRSSVSYAISNNIEILTLIEGAGNISGTGNASSNTITGNSGNNLLDGGAANDSLYGLAGNDTLLGGTGDDLLDGGTGADSLIGGDGNDVYYVDNSGDIVNEATSTGTDNVISNIANYTLTTNVENLTLASGAGNINGTGNVSANTIIGNTGDNIIDGGTGADSMVGGAGNDIYYVDAGDIVDEVSLGGAGIDTVISSISYNLTNGVENLTLASGAGNINGTGNASNNTIIGNSGNNIIDGGTGTDSMVGGAGNDTYYVDNSADAILENAGEGTVDLVYASANYTLSDNIEILTMTGTAITGAGNASDNSILGNAQNNTLSGLAGNDTIDGSTGTDIMIGGTGNDIYYVDNTGDVIQENAGAGTDTVYSIASGYTISTDVEYLILSGTGNTNGYGNVGVNTILGNSGNNILDGGVNDGAVDLLNGGAGDDTYYIYEFATADTINEDAGGGTDKVIFKSTSGTYSLLGTNLENLELDGTADISGTGSLGVNIIIGNSGKNTLDGGGADGNADILNGGDGDDTYLIYQTTAIDSIIDSSGVDTVIYKGNTGTWVLDAGLENLILDGTAAIGGTGNSSINTIVGNSGANTLDGGGADGAIDVLNGGAGNDIYNVYEIGANADSIIDSAGADTIVYKGTSGTYTLDAGIESLTLDGTAAINGTGNSAVNTILGNSGNNILDGGGADGVIDLLNGGAGDDTYNVYQVVNADSIIDSAGADTIVYKGTSGTYTLDAGIEILTLDGTAVISGTGNSAINTINGNSGNNTLDGGGTDGVSDSLVGGAGDDTYNVYQVVNADIINDTSGVDTVVYKGTTGTWTLDAGIEILTLDGTAAISGTGNSAINTIVGNSGANTLDGGGADGSVDVLNGDAGNDVYNVYEVDANADLINDTAGIDTVVYKGTSGTYTLDAGIEILTLYAGTAAINGTGNNAINTIIGNSGNNILDGGGTDGVTDSLVGGAGNDIYNVYQVTGADKIVEAAGEGTDTVIFSGTVGTTYTLDTNVENLTLGGFADIGGLGNLTANSILGNDGNNTLDGGGADGLIDSLIGGLGDDTYKVYQSGALNTDYINDIGGNDTVLFGGTSGTYTLDNNIENLTLGGTAAINGTGNDLANYMSGNSGANTLLGGLGDDTLWGGSGGIDYLDGGGGNDTYIIDRTTGITINDSGAGEVDTILVQVGGSISLTSYGAIENGVRTVSGTLIGTLGNNTLVGSSGNDTLLGGSVVAANGDDTLEGGSGADSLYGGAGDDVYLFDTGDGQDTVNDGGPTNGTSTADKISFKSNVNTTYVAFFKSTRSLQIDYGITSGQDRMSITNQFATNGGYGSTTSTMEQFRLSDGYYMTAAEVNTVLGNMSTYVSTHPGTSFANIDDVRSNPNLMAIIAAGWHL